MKQRTSFNEFASTVALGAVAVGIPATEAVAQEPYVVTVDGGLSFSDFSEEFLDEKGGAVPDPDGDVGFFGSVAVSQKLSDTWDWRVSASLLSFGDNTISVRSPPTTASLSQSLNAYTADADFGWLTTTGNTNLRFGVGLLATSYDKGIGFEVTDGIDAIRGNADVEYTGIGPKLSVDLTNPVSDDGRMSLIAGASIAPTKGDLDLSITARSTMGGSESDFASVDADALVSSAYLGMSMKRDDTSEWRFGLRLDNIDTDVDEIGDDGVGLLNGSVLTTTAFVGLKIQF